MEKEAFAVLKGLEGTWWHEGRKYAIKEGLSAAKVERGSRVLDVGAGYGSMYPLLSTYGAVDASEPNEEAGKECVARGYETFYTSEEEILETPQRYHLIGAFDVIEHVEDDVTFVKNLFKLTTDGGALVATVPAFQWLWSAHDVSHQHFRRHTSASMRRLLTSAGYEIAYVRYWNTLLFPAVLITRLLGSSGEAGLHVHPFINKTLIFLLALEAKFMRWFPLPLGLSVVIVGKKVLKRVEQTTK